MIDWSLYNHERALSLGLARKTLKTEPPLSPVARAVIVHLNALVEQDPLAKKTNVSSAQIAKVRLIRNLAKDTLEDMKHQDLGF